MIQEIKTSHLVKRKMILMTKVQLVKKHKKINGKNKKRISEIKLKFKNIKLTNIP